jgi:hypothetical protein
MLKGATLPACHIQTFVISSLGVSPIPSSVCSLWVSTTGRIVFVADNAEWLRFIIYCALEKAALVWMPLLFNRRIETTPKSGALFETALWIQAAGSFAFANRKKGTFVRALF